MKKVLIALAASGMTAGAFAQSNVTIYGSMDAGVTRIDDVGGRSVARLDQGTMQPDRIGFRGAEDLGGGLRATFHLETGFFTDTGAMTSAGRLFNRASTVGLAGGFGAVTLGNQPDIVFDYAGKLSNGFQLTNFYLFHPGNLDNLANTFQFNNSIRYTSPTFSGLTVSAMYGLGEVAGDNHRNSNYSAGANYATGPFRAALAYSRQNDRAAGFAGTFLGSLGLGTAATVFDKLTTIAAGAGYTMGNFRMNALYTQSKIDFAGPTDATQKNYDIGVAWRYTPGNTLNVGYTHSRLESAKYNQLSVGNVYSFSKRTELYVQAAYQRAGGSAQFAVQNNTGVARSDSQLVTSVGIHHSF